MSIEDVIRRYWREIWNEGSTEAVAGLYDPECRQYGRFSVAGFQRNVAATFAGFPDLSVEVIEAVASGDTVVTRVRYRGTHTGPYLGLEPTGRTIDMTGMDMFRVRDGRIVEHWHEADHDAMFRQLGLAPISRTSPAAYVPSSSATLACAPYGQADVPSRSSMQPRGPSV